MHTCIGFYFSNVINLFELFSLNLLDTWPDVKHPMLLHHIHGLELLSIIIIMLNLKNDICN